MSAIPKNVQILWCGTPPKTRGGSGWAFPRTVADTITEACAGMSVLHLFGGHAKFGIRMDIDPYTQPHVVGDAWLPPFKRNAFDVVVLDPPYVGEFANLNSQKLICLFLNAAWIARRRVIWFHPMWIDTKARVRFEQGYLVRIGRGCVLRSLQFFRVPQNRKKLRPPTHFQRGPAIRYNRWLAQPQGLPFGGNNGNRNS